jgi:hypothetical protein
MAEEIDELKKLSPKERIKKLKELQEKNKEEIEKAQKLAKEAEEQAEVEDELREVPIPQLKAVNIEELFTPEERELFKAKRFAASAAKVEDEKPKEKVLEAIAETAPRLTSEEEEQHIQYLQGLAERKTEDLYTEAKELYTQFKVQGNRFTAKQQNRFYNITSATERKFQDAERGKYVEVSEDVARRMVKIEEMKHAIYRRAA